MANPSIGIGFASVVLTYDELKRPCLVARVTDLKRRGVAMIAMATEYSMRPDPAGGARISAIRLADMDYTDERSGHVRCVLHLGRSAVAIDLPAEVIDEHRMDPKQGIYLEMPGEQSKPVQEGHPLSRSEREWAEGWIREMESFDGF